jgi:ketosteroid isomerase-like protein
MSRENVELLERAYDAFNRRDWDAFVALMDEDIEAESRLAAVEGGYRGHEGLRRWWDDLLGMLPDYRIEVEEIRGLGDETLSRFEARGHGASSATPLVDPGWHVGTWRHGKAVWWRVCATEEEAFEAIARRGGAG